MALLPESPRNVTGNYDQVSKEITDTLRRCGFLPEDTRVYLKSQERGPDEIESVRYRPGFGAEVSLGGPRYPGDLILTFAVAYEPPQRTIAKLPKGKTRAEFIEEQAKQVRKPGVTVTIDDKPFGQFVSADTPFPPLVKTQAEATEVFSAAKDFFEEGFKLEFPDEAELPPTRFDRGTKIKLVTGTQRISNRNTYTGFVYEAEAGDRLVVKVRVGAEPKGRLIARIYADAWRLTASGSSDVPILEALGELRYEPAEEAEER